MLIVVFYDPVDGRIISCAQTPQASADLNRYPYIQVPEYRMDYDSTHKVVNGELVPLDQ